MNIALAYETVHLQDLALDPQRVHEYLFSVPSYVFLSFIPLKAPPPGQIRLVVPVRLSDDPKIARAQQRALSWLRVQSQNLILASDCQALARQGKMFSLYTRMLMWQRGFDDFLIDPAGPVWGRKFANRDVIKTAEHLYVRHGDVRLRIDIASSEFDLCGPSTRARQKSDEIRVSLRPVVDALSMEGLWVDPPDERFRDLARVMVRLGQGEHRRVGRPEFIRRCGQGEH